MTTKEEFRLFLQNELIRRCRANPRYSVRSFAKALKMDPSTLAKVLAGKRPLGKRAISSLGAKLGLSPQDMARFTDENGTQAAADYQRISQDHFAIISDWFHFAILELMTVRGFDGDPKWIAKTLGLSLADAKGAIDRLVRVGMIEILPNGKWLDKSSGRTTNISPDFTSSALRQLQRQILEKAIAALEEVPVTERDQTALTMAVDRSKLPEAKERIRKFRRELAEFISCGQKHDDVYNMTISLYPLTTLKRS